MSEFKREEIKNILIRDDNVYIFCDNIEKNIKILQRKYSADNSKIHLGYELPDLLEYTFFDKKYHCIRLWFDGEIDMIDDFYKDFDSVKNIKTL